MFTEKLSHLSWGWGCFAGRGSSGPCTTCRCARSSRCPAGAAKLPPARRSHTRCARPVGGPCPLWLEGQNTHTGQTQWWMNLIHLVRCDLNSWSFLWCLFENNKKKTLWCRNNNTQPSIRDRRVTDYSEWYHYYY